MGLLALMGIFWAPILLGKRFIKCDHDAIAKLKSELEQAVIDAKKK